MIDSLFKETVTYGNFEKVIRDIILTDKSFDSISVKLPQEVGVLGVYTFSLNDENQIFLEVIPNSRSTRLYDSRKQISTSCRGVDLKDLPLFIQVKGYDNYYCVDYIQKVNYVLPERYVDNEYIVVAGKVIRPDMGFSLPVGIKNLILY